MIENKLVISWRGVGVRGCLQRDTVQEGPEVMKIFYILIEVTATRVFTLSKLIEL